MTFIGRKRGTKIMWEQLCDKTHFEVSSVSITLLTCIKMKYIKVTV